MDGFDVGFNKATAAGFLHNLNKLGGTNKTDSLEFFGINTIKNDKSFYPGLSLNKNYLNSGTMQTLAALNGNITPEMATDNLLCDVVIDKKYLV